MENGRSGAGYRYRHVEAALATVFEIKPDEIGAFRGRLRHLRNIGAPELPKPGSGQQIEYTREHVVEVMLAVELATLGVAPRHAVRAAKYYAKVISRPDRDTVGRRDCLIVTHFKQFGGSEGDSDREEMAKAEVVRGNADPEARLVQTPDVVTSLQPFTDVLATGLLLNTNRFAVLNLPRSLVMLDDALRSAAEK
jgi:hypothetical protein